MSDLTGPKTVVGSKTIPLVFLSRTGTVRSRFDGAMSSGPSDDVSASEFNHRLGPGLGIRVEIFVIEVSDYRRWFDGAFC